MSNGNFDATVRYLRRSTGRLGTANLSDRRLLTLFLTHRDEYAFYAIVQRHGSMVWGVCQRVLANQHDADDVFQATFLVLLIKQGRSASGIAGSYGRCLSLPN